MYFKYRECILLLEFHYSSMIFTQTEKTTIMAQDTVQTIRELEASIDKNVQNTNGISY